MLDLEVLSGEFVKVVRNGQVVAFLEYDWVKDAQDMLRADRGDPPLGGDVLYISNLRVTQPDHTLIWELRRRLPPHRWIVGLDEGWMLHAPKGVPDGFYV